MDPPAYAEALGHTFAATLLRPDTAVFQLRLGDCYAGLGAYPQALAAFKKSVELGRGAVVGYLHMGDALAKKKDWDGAVAAVREAVRLQPNNVAAHSKLATILFDAGRPAEGLRTLVAVIRKHPDWAKEPRYYLRYNAACLAVGCADGLGSDPPPQGERPAYRKQALDFLTAELAAIRNSAAQNPAQVHKDMQLWLSDKDLASVREPASLARLPMDEREAWNDLWREVRHLRGQNGG
jgi:tetratricopeptide (TPR) repeat protein